MTNKGYPSVTIGWSSARRRQKPHERYGTQEWYLDRWDWPSTQIKPRSPTSNGDSSFWAIRSNREKVYRCRRKRWKSNQRWTSMPSPKDKSIQLFRDTIQAWTHRRIPLTVFELIDSINPVIRGWGNYFRKAHVRKLFNWLQRWIIRRIWNHRFKRWRNALGKKLPESTLYSTYRLVNLLSLILDFNRRTALRGWHEGKRIAIARKPHDLFERADGGWRKPTSFDLQSWSCCNGNGAKECHHSARSRGQLVNRRIRWKRASHLIFQNR